MAQIEMLDAWAEFLGRNARPKDMSPWAALDRWDALVDQAMAGYPLGYYDFSNDLAVRDLLAQALEDETLMTFEQIGTIQLRVAAADARFRSSLLPGVEVGPASWPWWHRGVLARSGDEYADDMDRLYGIEVPRIEGDGPI